MYVVIAGGGRTGATLAGVLIGQDHEVRVVEHRPEVLAHLHRELPTEAIHQGNPVYPEVLEAAGIGRAAVFAACLPDDPDNLAVCFVARVRFKVGRTIACINNPRNAWLFGPAFHVDVALNQAQILASLILEEMSLGDMMTLLKLRRGRFSLVEEKIPAGAPAVGRFLKDLALPPQSVIAAVIRGGEILIPRGALQFDADDEVLAICDPAGAEELAALFGGAAAAPRSAV
jgi:trk system potassium uptake protein TrkA